MSSFAYLKLQTNNSNCDILVIPKELSTHYSFIFDQLIQTNRDVVYLDEVETGKMHFSSEVVGYTEDDDMLILLKTRADYEQVAKDLREDVFRFFKLIPEFQVRVAKYMLLGLRAIIENSNRVFQWKEFMR